MNAVVHVVPITVLSPTPTHRYNYMKETLAKVEAELTRMHDPLQLNLPILLQWPLTDEWVSNCVCSVDFTVSGIVIIMNNYEITTVYCINIIIFTVHQYYILFVGNWYSKLKHVLHTLHKCTYINYNRIGYFSRIMLIIHIVIVDYCIYVVRIIKIVCFC